MRRRILRALVREGALTERQVEQALELEQESGNGFDRILREKGWVTEERFLTVVHRKTFWPYERTLGSVSVPPEFTERVPLAVARKHAGVNSNLLTDEEALDALSGNCVLNGIPVELAPAP